jgi:uncharacterized protein
MGYPLRGVRCKLRLPCAVVCWNFPRLGRLPPKLVAFDHPTALLAAGAAACVSTESSVVNRVAALPSAGAKLNQDADCHTRLRHAIEHSARLLPAQAPIRVFVHHNTLHAFEDQTFGDAVQHGSATYGCRPYLPEERYRTELARGRIRTEDLSAVLIDDLGEEADRLVSFLATRYHLRLAMLQYPLRIGSDPERMWLIAEGEALRRFSADAPAAARKQMIAETRRWVMRDLRSERAQVPEYIKHETAALFERFGESKIERWSDETWESFTLHLLWSICRHGVEGVKQRTQSWPPLVRPRDFLLQATGIDSDPLVNDVLIRFCAAFIDQGVASWPLPGRELGFFRCFVNLYRNSRPVERWMRRLPEKLARIDEQGPGPLQVIEESLCLLGIAEADEEEFLSQTLLALRGWAGMIWQMETNAEWTVRPAPTGTLVEYAAVRLLLERLALRHLAGEALGPSFDLRDLKGFVSQTLSAGETSEVDQRALVVFQLAQYSAWNPIDLCQLSAGVFANLVEEVESFSDVERRRVYHLAFERRFRNKLLDAVITHSRRARVAAERPRFQVICCLDEREESFRRHLEEVAADCETFATAGFFGVAMFYQGAADAHYVPLCPVVIQPRHYVREEVVYSFEDSHRRRTETRRALGRASHRLHTRSISVFGGALTAIFGALASVPLVARVLFPRSTSRVRRIFGSFVQPPPVTRLSIERIEPFPGPQVGHLGYSLDEMVHITGSVLREIGLTHNFARLVVLMGHGSSSLNNPHASAYDCGACGGGRGGPNARAFAGMVNDPRVRERLAAGGLVIPRQTVFVGAWHNTCDDSISYSDLDQLPSSHHDDFDAVKASFDEARRRNAHERCRRFESADLTLSPESALRHVEGRAEDLSQVRSECGHASNAVCFVGRRARTRGLFLDRRAFLASYDPAQDDPENSLLTRILQAVIPVCAGINLEYYFSYTDPSGYGCGSKLPHNITALLGVMNGAASDLRPGLPWQMVEIHEPLRLLLVIEGIPQGMLVILKRNPAIGRLVRNEWVQLAVLDPASSAIQVFRNGGFEPYRPEGVTIPTVATSVDWYRGQRDHLDFASIEPHDLQETGTQAEGRQ